MRELNVNELNHISGAGFLGNWFASAPATTSITIATEDVGKILEVVDTAAKPAACAAFSAVRPYLPYVGAAVAVAAVAGAAYYAYTNYYSTQA